MTAAEGRDPARREYGRDQLQWSFDAVSRALRGKGDVEPSASSEFFRYVARQVLDTVPLAAVPSAPAADQSDALAVLRELVERDPHGIDTDWDLIERARAVLTGAVPTAAAPTCTCTPLPQCEGPCSWCDVHGQPSVAWDQGVAEGTRQARELAAIEAAPDAGVVPRSSWPWRQCRHCDHHVYRQTGTDPSDTDQWIGSFPIGHDALIAVTAVNAVREAALRGQVPAAAPVAAPDPGPRCSKCGTRSCVEDRESGWYDDEDPAPLAEWEHGPPAAAPDPEVGDVSV